MALYNLGSSGPEVSQIELKLQQIGLYNGAIDGLFGAETESAVRAFQTANGLSVDGVVGPETWQALFPQPIVSPVVSGPPVVAGQGLESKCLALTGSFETSLPVPDCFAGLAGNFDGQGISFGALQWNLGQGTLQPMLRSFSSSYPAQWQTIFGANADVLTGVLQGSVADQISWAKTIQTSSFVLMEPWNGQFKTLGGTPEYQQIELDTAKTIYSRAYGLIPTYQLTSERAVALMFDILVQDGSISAVTQSQIFAQYATIDPTLGPDDLEVARMVIVAKCRAAAANPSSYQDVLSRKMTIAEGTGTVHGTQYDLSTYGLSLAPA
jgi:peptidoglycan hydrolase-like protein with peptidoglycan-binding domain